MSTMVKLNHKLWYGVGITLPLIGILGLLLSLEAVRSQPLLYPTQQTWTDGSLSGSEAILWLSFNPSTSDPIQPSLYTPVRFRLAGIEPPQSTGGGITGDLAEKSTNYLSYQISTNRLEAQTLSLEKILTWDLNLPRQTTVIRYIGFLRIPEVESHPSYSIQKGWTDLGLLMLRTGWVRLARDYPLELQCCPEVQEAYEAMEKEAKDNQRGIWRYPWLFRNREVDRDPKVATPLPKRGN